MLLPSAGPRLPLLLEASAPWTGSLDAEGSPLLYHQLHHAGQQYCVISSFPNCGKGLGSGITAQVEAERVTQSLEDFCSA